MTRQFTTVRSFTSSCSLAGLLVLSVYAAGCASKQKEPPPKLDAGRLPDPPEVRDVTLVRPDFYRVGDNVNIVLDAVGGQIPIVWSISGLPSAWVRTTGTEGRFYNLSGRLPLGSSDKGLDIKITLTDGNGQRSKPLSIHINVKSKSYDFQPTLISTSEGGLLKEYSLQLRSLPDWDADYPGRVEIWVDSTGLAGSPSDQNNSRDAPNTIRLWDASVRGMNMINIAVGDTQTSTNKVDDGELFVINSPEQRRAIDDGELYLTIRSRTNPGFRVPKIRVTVY